jgi:predicted short-subunit dehydrogenase-like oxidoreductase (DUF2520 family)
MIKVVIIGSGNVAHHLVNAFAKSEAVDVVQVFSRNRETVSAEFNSVKISSDLDNLVEADLFIIAVSDDSVAEIASVISINDRFVVHTSGALTMDCLNTASRRGAFYPLQTFSKQRAVDFNNIPICLECENETDLELLKVVANAISDKVFIINSKQRKALHLSAVFVNNFVNHLYHIGNEICIENQLSFELLKPLIAETANKVMLLSPEEAQTGPAKRGDYQSIQAHLDIITDENQKKIYQILTQSIQNNGKEL